MYVYVYISDEQRHYKKENKKKSPYIGNLKDEIIILFI